MKVLQLAYHYPPMGGAGVQRALKFSKYLPQHGVQPVVLAGADPHYVQDQSLLADVPAGLEVHRIEFSPWVARLAARRRQLLLQRQGLAAPAPAAPVSGAPAWRDGLRDGALRAVRALQLPDDTAPWARLALRKGLALAREHAARGTPFELVFSSAPPVSLHWLGARLGRELGLPWVADWRDLWTANPGYAAPAWRRRIDEHSERRWLAQAAGVVTVTPSWQQYLAGRAGPATATAFIPNGYDEADFSNLPSLPRERDAFRLLHTGTFYGHQSPLPALAGVAAYLALDPPPARPLKLRLVGNIGARFEPALAEFDARHPGVLERAPYVPHRQALAEMLAADALLLIVGGAAGAAPGSTAAGILPGKIFEYLRAQRPLLLLGPEQGDAATLVRRHARAQVVDERDPQRIARALHDVIHGTAAGAPSVPASPACFERRALAGQLAHFMRDCVARHGGAG